MKPNPILATVQGWLPNPLVPAQSWVRLIGVLWILLVVLGIGRAALYQRGPAHRGCYAIFADSGRHWLASAPLYDSANPTSMTVFRYSPLLAACCVPLALLPDPVGSAVLRAVSLAVVVLAFWWWSRAFLPRNLPEGPHAVAWLLWLGMGCVSMTDVQMNLLTISCILIGLAAASAERWNLAALVLSLACCLKAYPVSLALVLAVVHPRRFAGRWLASLALCLALPFLLQRPAYVWEQYGEWLRWGLNQRRPDEVPFQDMMLFCQLWLTPISARTYLLLEVGVGALIAAVCLARRWQGIPERDLLNTCAGMCCGWMMAFGPATEATTYVQLAPVVAGFTVLAWVTPLQRTMSAGVTCHAFCYRGLVTASCVLLTLSQLQLLLPLHKPMHAIAAQPFAALLLMLAAGLQGQSPDADSTRLPAASFPERVAA